MMVIQFSSAVRRIQPAYACATIAHAPNITAVIPDWRDARSADPKTTMRYLGASAQKERDAVQKLRFRDK